MRSTHRPFASSRSTPTSVEATVPSAYSAHKVACSTLTGRTRPLQFNKVLKPSITVRKSLLYCSIMDSSKFPPVCPPRRPFSKDGNRESSNRRASPSLRAKASAHFKTSPGGKKVNRKKLPYSEKIKSIFTVRHFLLCVTTRSTFHLA